MKMLIVEKFWLRSVSFGGLLFCRILIIILALAIFEQNLKPLKLNLFTFTK